MTEEQDRDRAILGVRIYFTRFELIMIAFNIEKVEKSSKKQGQNYILPLWLVIGMDIDSYFNAYKCLRTLLGY